MLKCEKPRPRENGFCSMAPSNKELAGKTTERRRDAIQPYVENGSWKRFDSLEEFSQQYSGDWVTGEVRYAGEPIDFAVKPKKGSRRLAVVFNSQQTPGGGLKLFTWMKVAQRLNCSRLHIADPTLNLSNTATLGWYTSNSSGNMQAGVEGLIREVVTKLNVEEIVFLGSSGGGFPAAYYSQRFRNSIALLLAPVLAVERSLQVEPMRLFLEDLNGALTFPQVKASHPDVTYDVLDEIQKNDGELLGSLHILQSRHDMNFWRSQTQPFLQALGLDYESCPAMVRQGKISAVFGDWGEGHRPPPIEVINAAVDSIAEVPYGRLENFKLSETIP